MPMKNRLKNVLEEQLGEQITAYKFRQKTGLGQSTSLNAIQDEDWYPDKKSAEVICKVFGLQPGQFIYYVSED